MVARDTPGIAIGGLSGGEAKEDYCRVVAACTEMLPELKPRCVMGIGYPEDLVVSVAPGADMFDCVWPTRTARFGNAISQAWRPQHQERQVCGRFWPPWRTTADAPVVGQERKMALSRITRAFVHHNVSKETVAAHCINLHNVWYQLNLMKEAREAISRRSVSGVYQRVFGRLYPDRPELPVLGG